ncbi:MAG: c-type cytochrome [Anaerolineales bacterium]|nr:c-type cytochrome [Anaerolineales bacterium]
MNEEQKKQYKDKYSKAKQEGVKFWPDIIYKDLLITFALFLLLVMLATFVGVAQEPKADPGDSSYVPRPEWYFLFLFEMLKFFPGVLEWVGTAVIPGIAVLALLLLPFYDRNPNRHWSKRRLGITIMGVIVVAMIGLTIRAVATTPPQAESAALASTLSEQILLGEEHYGIQCVECHGAEGEGGEVKGVEGFEGVVLEAINTRDLMYTFTDDTLYNIIDYGQPESEPAMTPFGRSFGGELGPGEIEAIVAFMRYTWDDRAEIPAEVTQAAAMPALGPDEVPSYEVHIQPIVKRYCVSCHREGKNNNNYFMSTYDEIINTGDHAPNLVAGDMNSNTILMLNRQEIEAGGPMPPTKALKPELLDIFVRWIMGGMPETAEDAAAVSGTGAAPETVAEPTPYP